MEDSPVSAVVAPMRIGCCASAAEEPDKPKPRQRIASQESLTQGIKSSRTPESAITIRHSNARQEFSNGSEATFSTGQPLTPYFSYKSRMIVSGLGFVTIRLASRPVIGTPDGRDVTLHGGLQDMLSARMDHAFPMVAVYPIK